MVKKQDSAESAISDGTRVRFKPLSKTGEVLSVLGDGSVKVAFGTAVMRCHISELEALPPKSDDSPKNQQSIAPQLQREYQRNRGAIECVDLHGLTAAEAVHVALDKVDKALLIGCEQIVFIHGHGSGRVKDALHSALASLAIVRKYEVDPFNSGKTWVYF